MDVSTGSGDAVEDVGKGDCYTAERAMLDTGKSFFTTPGEVAFFVKCLCAEAWVQREASSEGVTFQLVAFGPFHHLKSHLDTNQPFR